MVINELDTFAEVAESLRDSGWSVVSSSLRLFAYRPGMSFSIGKVWKDREDSAIRLTHMEITVGGKDYEMSYTADGRPIETATFAANNLPIFRDIGEHIMSYGSLVKRFEVYAMEMSSRIGNCHITINIGYNHPLEPKMYMYSFDGNSLSRSDKSIVGFDAKIAIKAIDEFIARNQPR